MTVAKNDASNYVQLDYFKELANKTYQENESFDAFVERMAEQYFPGRSKEWMQRYAFSIRFYGICVEACKSCTGECAHHGHQYHLRIKKGSSCPVPWASAEVCEKYKHKASAATAAATVSDPLDEDVIPDMDEMFSAYNPFSNEHRSRPKKKKYEQQSLL